MFCNKCGTNNLNGSRFCVSCGFDMTPQGNFQQMPPNNFQINQYARPARQTNGLAIASMVLGILWLYWIGSILALIFGYQARKAIDSSNGTQEGRGMATAGIVLGWIGIAFLVIGVIAVAGSTGY